MALLLWPTLRASAQYYVRNTGRRGQGRATMAEAAGPEGDGSAMASYVSFLSRIRGKWWLVVGQFLAAGL